MQSRACLLSFVHIFKKSILKKKSHREKFKYSMVIFSFETFGSKEIDVAHCPEFFFFPHCVACSSPMKDQTWTVGSESSLNHWTIRGFLAQIFKCVFLQRKIGSRDILKELYGIFSEFHN